MVQPIGSFSPPRLPPAEAPSAGLEAQLARCQNQLGDAVNCATAKTPSGKAKIQEIENQIRSIKARMEAAALAKKPNPPVRTDESKASDPSHLGSLLDLST
jgi:hypothetical protein